MFDKTKNVQQAIPIAMLKNHPDNIRTSYTEIDELAESIRQKGILQNLTVVPEPGHEDTEDSFLVIIGNRRLKAAQVAAVETLPCIIAWDMTLEEQREIMLVENMQRSDLTPYEEGTAVQMMLDLGNSLDDIAGKTGLSKSTIRHRAEIAKLDRETVEKRLTESTDSFFQLTLSDLQELEKVHSIADRDKILAESQDSATLRYKVLAATRKYALQKKDAVLRKILKRAKVPVLTENPTISGTWDVHLKVNILDSFPEYEELIELKKAHSGLHAYIAEATAGISELLLITKKAVTPVDPKKAIEKDRVKKRHDILVHEWWKFFETINQCVIDIFDGTLKAPEGQLDMTDKLWDILMMSDNPCVKWTYACGLYYKKSRLEVTWADYQAMEKSNADKAAWMLLSTAATVKENTPVTYDCAIKEDALSNILGLVDVLKNYGFTVEDDFKDLLDGTNELYKRKETA